MIEAEQIIGEVAWIYMDDWYCFLTIKDKEGDALQYALSAFEGKRVRVTIEELE